MTEKEKQLLEKLLQKEKDEKKKDKEFFAEVLRRKEEVLKFLKDNEKK